MSMKRVTLLAALLLLTLLPARGALINLKTDLPEWYRKLLHKWDDYQILVIRSRTPGAEIDKLMAAPDNYRLVAWQAAPEVTREADIKRLRQWVSEGGTVWFQDSRLAELFGFENYPIEVGDLPAQKFKATFAKYGDGKAEGATLFGMKAPHGAHPALSGVDYVQFWAIRVGDAPGGTPKTPGLYSAVKATPEVGALLCYDPTSNGPLHEHLAAAFRTEGAGTIIFKPLVWEDPYTGARFQYNLLEWSAGFGVPDPTSSGPTARSPRRRLQQAGPTDATAADAAVDQVTFLDKHVLSGVVTSKEIKLVQFEPVLSTGNIAFNQVKSIVLQVDGAHDVVTMRDGRRLTGSVSFPEDLMLRNASGTTQKIKKSEILRVTLHDAPAAPPDKKGK